MCGSVVGDSRDQGLSPGLVETRVCGRSSFTPPYQKNKQKGLHDICCNIVNARIRRTRYNGENMALLDIALFVLGGPRRPLAFCFRFHFHRRAVAVRSAVEAVCDESRNLNLFGFSPKCPRRAGTPAVDVRHQPPSLSVKASLPPRTFRCPTPLALTSTKTVDLSPCLSLPPSLPSLPSLLAFPSF